MSDNPFGGAATKTSTTKSKPKAEEGDGFDTAAADGEVKPGKPADPFSMPSAFSDGKITEYEGELLLVKPTEVIEEMDTQIGRAENVVRADVSILTGDEAGETKEDMLIFQLALKRSLLKVLDGNNPYLLGRLGKGKAKAGKSAPYIFETPDEEDVALARKFLAR